VPGLSFSHQAATPSPAPAVWKALQRAEAWESIIGVKEIEAAGFDNAGDLTGYRFKVAVGGVDYAGSARRIASVPGRSMTLAIDSPHLQGAVTVTLEPADPGTAVRVDLTMSPNGFLASFMFPMIAAAVGRELGAAVDRFVGGLG
jgi:hypothetical protein